MRRCSFLLASLLLGADSPAPKPLTPDQKTEALSVALSASQARVTLSALAEQYRQVEAELKQLEVAEKLLLEKLRKDSGASESCRLNLKAEWVCK